MILLSYCALSVVTTAELLYITNGGVRLFYIATPSSSNFRDTPGTLPSLFG